MKLNERPTSFEKIIKPENINKRIAVCVIYKFVNGEPFILAEVRIPRRNEPNVFKLPGGTLNGGESAVKGLKREVFEELQYIIGENELIYMGEEYVEMTDDSDPELNINGKYCEISIFCMESPFEEVPKPPLNDDIESYRFVKLSEFYLNARRPSYKLAVDSFKNNLYSFQILEGAKTLSKQINKHISFAAQLVANLRYV